MKLKILTKDMEEIDIKGLIDVDISGIAYDSRTVKKGDLFVAVKGEKSDGHNFIDDAIKRGASVVVCEKQFSGDNLSKEIVLFKVADARKALAFLSNNFYEKPSEKMTVIGITGTNGKTTTSYIIKSIFEAWGKSVGLIGTINYLIKDKRYDAPHTTPEAPDFQSMLSEMLSSGCTHVVTEVSSHSLSQKRVDYTNFKTAVFTNLTRDHLDFHMTMEDYFDAKARLFYELLSKKGTAVINFDDIWGRKLIEGFKGNCLTYGIEQGADFAAVNINSSYDGLVFEVKFKDQVHKIKSHFIGLHNVYNVLSAIGAAFSAGVPFDVIKKGIENTEDVKGRFEKVNAGQDFLCIVDYAHTEDALERLIYTAIELKNSFHKDKIKIITVFGCGGNRDKGKRPKMGAIATKLSDVVVITSDNPRDEDPDQIIKEIVSGASRNNFIVKPDRKSAIKEAVETAEAGDILLLAGKGHEDYQIIKGEKHKFSDRETVEEAIKEKLKGKHKK